MMIRRGILIQLAAVLLALPVRGQSSISWAEPWSQSTGRLVLEAPNATVRVEAGRGDSVRIVVTGDSAALRLWPRPAFNGGEVQVHVPFNNRRVDVMVQLPPHFDVVLRGSNGGLYSVAGIHGEIDVDNSNAGIRIDGARRSVLAVTSNGPIVVQCDEVPLSAALSFITSNDSVSVTLPANVSAEVFLETDNGGIMSDFVSGSGSQQGNPIRSLRAIIGTGSASLRVRTDNGMIWLRRAAQRR